ncbi:MAG: septation ring formation regulator EzrA [Bacilli bacterium]|nr:septation ring formation regulator EzrA [Bacilli bacterium]
MGWQEFISSTQGIVIIVVALLVVFAVVIILFRLKTKQKRLASIIFNYEHQVLDINNIPVQSKLTKLEVIGKNNVVYASVFAEYSKNYKDTCDYYDEELKKQFDIAKAQVSNKEYTSFSNTIKSIEVSVSSYMQKVNQLDSQLQEIMKDEIDTKSYEEKVRSLYVDCKKNYDDIKSDLEVLEVEYLSIFENINNKFDLYDNDVKSGNYTDAKDILEIIEKEVIDLKNKLLQGQNPIKRATKIIPQHLNEVIDLYNEMQGQDYPLYHIVAVTTINSIKDSVSDIVSLLRNFSFDGIDEAISEVDNKIADLHSKLDNEKNSRIEFDEKNKLCYDQAEDLERAYIKYMREASQLGTIYQIDKDLEQKSLYVKNEVNKLSIIRKTLDSLNYGQQPYSLRVEKMREMVIQVEAVERGIKEYKDSIANMRDNAEYAYDLVYDSSYKLKNAQIAIRNSKHEFLQDKYVDNFNYSYSLIEKLSSLISKAPIDTQSVNKYSKELSSNCNEVINNVNEDILLLKIAEKLLMHANSYRSSFSDVARNLAKAEMFYFEGRFKDAIDLTIEATSRFYIPEQLTKIDNMEEAL